MHSQLGTFLVLAFGKTTLGPQSWTRWRLDRESWRRLSIWRVPSKWEKESEEARARHSFCIEKRRSRAMQPLPMKWGAVYSMGLVHDKTGLSVVSGSRG